VARFTVHARTPNKIVCEFIRREWWRALLFMHRAIVIMSLLRSGPQASEGRIGGCD
jgi:hypothetical protein